MRVFLVVLVLIFSLQSFTKAEDISDFEIEGMSAGDSALDFFTKLEIETGIVPHHYKDDEFYDVEINDHKLFKTYQNIQFSFKKNDKKYIIYALTGFDFYEKNVQACLDKVDVVSLEVENILQDFKKQSFSKNHAADPSGKSKTKEVYFHHETGTIVIECYDWSDKITKEKKWTDNFGVGIYLREFYVWMATKAY